MTSTAHTAPADLGQDRRDRDPMAWSLLVGSIALVALVAAIGRRWTDTATGSWYDRLDKPAWTPPGATFGIVWTALYLAMAVAAWLVARRGLARPDVRRAIVPYAVQPL